MDPIEKLDAIPFKASQLDGVLAVQGPTWKIRKELQSKDFVREYEKRPAETLRDFGAQPSDAIEPYFGDIDRIYKCIDKEKEVILPEKRNPEGKEVPESPLEQLRRLPEHFKGVPGLKYHLHIDLATGGEKGTGCNCGAVLGHVYSHIFTMDLITRFVGGGGSNEIQFEDVRTFIYELTARGFKIRRVTFDGWQSIDMIQTLNRRGYKAEVISVQEEEYSTLKDILYANRLRMYDYPPLMKELKSVERYRSNQITSETTKDIADALAGTVYGLVESGPKRNTSLQPRVTEGINITRGRHNQGEKQRLLQELLGGMI